MLDFLTLIPPKYRQWIYGVLSLAGVIVAAWRASDGHWDEAFYILLTSALPNTIARKNVTPEEPKEDPYGSQ